MAKSVGVAKISEFPSFSIILINAPMLVICLAPGPSVNPMPSFTKLVKFPPAILAPKLLLFKIVKPAFPDEPENWRPSSFALEEDNSATIASTKTCLVGLSKISINFRISFLFSENPETISWFPDE